MSFPETRTPHSTARLTWALTLLAPFAAPAGAVVPQSLTHRGRECRVKTDLNARVAKPIVKRLDRYCDHFEAFYDELGLKSRNNNKLVLRLFSSYDEYAEFYQRSAGGFSTPAAYFSPSLNGVVAYHDETDPVLRQVLFHETSHQYMNRYTSAAPKWANEGLAEYFEGWLLSPEGDLIKRRPAFYDLTVLQAALESKKSLGLEELVKMEPKKFMEFREHYPALDGYLHYATSWGLVYFFLEGPNEADREHFIAYLRSLNEDDQRAAPFEVEDWSALEERWREFVLGLEIVAETADDHLILAGKYRQAKEWDPAIAAYGKALELTPEAEGVRYWLGYCHKRSGDYDQAREHLVAAHGQEPDDPRPAYMLARIEAGFDMKDSPSDPAKALAYAEEASKRTGSESPFYLSFLAQCQNHAGDASAAVKTMKKVLKLVRKEEDDVKAYYQGLLESYGG